MWKRYEREKKKKRIKRTHSDPTILITDRWYERGSIQRFLCLSSSEQKSVFFRIRQTHFNWKKPLILHQSQYPSLINWHNYPPPPFYYLKHFFKWHDNNNNKTMIKIFVVIFIVNWCHHRQLEMRKNFKILAE